MKFNEKYFTALFIFLTLIFGCGKSEKQQMEEELIKFIKDYESKVIPLTDASALSYFEATISGKEEDYNRYASLEIKRSKLYTDKEDFAKLKRIKESNLIEDELLKRQLDILYNSYLRNQADTTKLEKIIQSQSEIENKFSVFRAELNGKKLTDNQIEEILKNSKDSKELQTAWLSSKKIGNVVSNDVISLVKLRNETARELGFKNYQEMSLKLSEQDPQEIEKIFDELDNLTRDTFIKIKNEIDEFLAKRYNIPKEKLMPWHYQNRYFQEAPKIYNVDLDSYYKDKNIAEVTKTYFDAMDLPIDDILTKSDLYEKEGKYQHAYCTTINRNTDVRVVMNIRPNADWMNTSLHEFGHAVYDRNIDQNLPWALREPAHTFTTEAIAQLFGRFASNPSWMKDVISISETEREKIADASFKSLRLQQLVFSRWSQVVYRFEKSMYENPDQDLNKLWWDLVEKYQMLKRPEGRNEPDWASKIHIASYPCYYHNYQLGELLASQLSYYIAEKVTRSASPKNESYFNKKEVGNYLRENIFSIGEKYPWNNMIEKATGEKLTAKYYAKQFLEN
jgi:peptidyl-dipeptidase A